MANIQIPYKWIAGQNYYYISTPNDPNSLINTINKNGKVTYTYFNRRDRNYVRNQPLTLQNNRKNVYRNSNKDEQEKVGELRKINNGKWKFVPNGNVKIKSKSNTRMNNGNLNTNTRMNNVSSNTNTRRNNATLDVVLKIQSGYTLIDLYIWMWFDSYHDFPKLYSADALRNKGLGDYMKNVFKISIHDEIFNKVQEISNNSFFISTNICQIITRNNKKNIVLSLRPIAPFETNLMIKFIEWAQPKGLKFTEYNPRTLQNKQVTKKIHLIMDAGSGGLLAETSNKNFVQYFNLGNMLDAGWQYNPFANLGRKKFSNKPFEGDGNIYDNRELKFDMATMFKGTIGYDKNDNLEGYVKFTNDYLLKNQKLVITGKGGTNRQINPNVLKKFFGDFSQVLYALSYNGQKLMATQDKMNALIYLWSCLAFGKNPALLFESRILAQKRNNIINRNNKNLNVNNYNNNKNKKIIKNRIVQQPQSISKLFLFTGGTNTPGKYLELMSKKKVQHHFPNLSFNTITTNSEAGARAIFHNSSNLDNRLTKILESLSKAKNKKIFRQNILKKYLKTYKFNQISIKTMKQLYSMNMIPIPINTIIGKIMNKGGYRKRNIKNEANQQLYNRYKKELNDIAKGIVLKMNNNNNNNVVSSYGKQTRQSSSTRYHPYKKKNP